MNKRVTGIGGVFFKAENPEKLKEWYRTHLGIESETWGAVFNWGNEKGEEVTGSTAWSVFKPESKKFEPSAKSFMINYRVENMAYLLKSLKEEGLEILEAQEDKDFGSFAWIMDPEGNKIELWEAPAGM